VIRTVMRRHRHPMSVTGVSSPSSGVMSVILRCAPNGAPRKRRPPPSPWHSSTFGAEPWPTAGRCTLPSPQFVMAALVPAIHVLLWQSPERRGCAAQGRA
jgi:hypothetical protein